MITIDEKTKYGTKNITGVGFRLIHNNTKVIALIEGTEKLVTSTNHKAEEYSTKQEVLNQIDALRLEYTNQDNPQMEHKLETI